eukprot:12891799-Prorocentrum_lima.AAC.1
MAVAWGGLGKFWTGNAPWRWKRAMFKGYVLNAGLSATDAFAGVAKRDSMALETKLVKYGRVLLLGAAVVRSNGH